MTFAFLSQLCEPADRLDHCVTDDLAYVGIRSNPAALKDKRVLITGGTGGVALETARIALNMGAAVLITGASPSLLQNAALDLMTTGQPVVAVVADATSPRGRSAAIAAANQLLGGLDVIIHCAGADVSTKVMALAHDEAVARISSELAAPMQLAEEALPHLQQSPDAVIVNVDGSVTLTTSRYQVLHSTIPANLFGFHDAWKTKLKQHGVRWLTFYPGDLTSFIGPANAVATALIVQVAHTLGQYSATLVS
jgi:NAD(P)-dependent dehydrogenase (short-subunit alcohol dehydrogenase family)